MTGHSSDRPAVPAGPRPTWLVLAAVLLAALNLRTAIMGFVPVLDAIASDLGFGAATVGLLATVPTAVFGVSAFVTPWLYRRVRGESLLATASLVTGAGIVARSFAADAWQLGGAFVVAVAGIGITNVVLVPIVKQYYAHRLGAINGAYLGAMQVGPIVAPVIAAVLIEQGTSWRPATGFWAALAVLAALAWGAQALVVRREVPLDTAAIAVLRAEARSIRIAQLFRSRLAWGIMLVFSMNSLSTYTLLTMLPARYVDAGESLTFGTSLLAVLPVLALVGSSVVPALTARMRHPFLLIVGFGVALLVGTAGVLFRPLDAPVVWASAIGLGLNCFPVAMTLMNLRSRTRAGAAALSGFGQGVGYLIASTGPLGIGLARIATDGWVVPFGLIALTVPVSIVAGWFATRERMIEDDVRGA